MRDELFTIQQYADLHEIGKRTLHFYDKIGLFSPAIKKENGYRYYSLSQGSTLEMILTLRELDMSLEDIKAYMDKRSPEAFHRLLEDKQKQVDDKIAELKEIKNLLKMKQVQTGYLSEDISSIKIVHCKQKNYFITLVNENYVEAMIDHGKSLPHHLFNTELGTLTASSNLYKGIYNHTEGIFSNTGNKKSNHTRPEGNYIRAFHVGDFSDLTSTYERILDYCRKQDLELEGYAYELGINDLCIMRIEEYVTMIEIKIK